MRSSRGSTMRVFHGLLIGFCLVVFSVTASAQWIDYPDPRIPRTGEGKPNLKAPAPKLPDGTPDFDGHFTPRKIIQVPGLIAILFESYHSYRQIFTDGRPLPKDPEPAWYGYSTAKWDKDTLVVDTNAINEATWLDDSGHPHSDALHITERFRRADFGHMDVQITIDDPKAYKKPWTVRLGWELMPDTDLLDWVCENEKDTAHISGK